MWYFGIVKNKNRLTPDNPNFACCLVLNTVVGKGKFVLIHAVGTALASPCVAIFSALIDHPAVFVTHHQSGAAVVL